MSAVALGLYVVALVVLFGVRSWVQRRRTGHTGFHGLSGTPADAGWWGGVLFVVAIVLGLAAPLLVVLGATPTDPPIGVEVVGLGLALAASPRRWPRRPAWVPPGGSASTRPSAPSW